MTAIQMLSALTHMEALNVTAMRDTLEMEHCA